MIGFPFTSLYWRLYQLELDGFTPTPAGTALPYVYRWDREGRKGQRCRVTARGKRNSISVEFADGFVMVTSGNAIRKAEAAS